MGGEKPFRRIGDQLLISRVIETASRQCDAVLVSSNDDPERFGEIGITCPVLPDPLPGGQGPLAGILAGVSAMPDGFDWMAVFPVDCPVVPDDMVVRLLETAKAQRAMASFIRHDGRDHVLSAILHRDAAKTISEQLAQNDGRVFACHQKMKSVVLEYPVSADHPAWFANINTPDDLDWLTKVLES